MGKSHDLATLKDDGGTFGGDLVIDNGAADGGQLHLKSSGHDNWYIDNSSGNFRIFQDGVVRQNIDASGRVTMPYQPSIFVAGTNNTYVAPSNGIVPFNLIKSGHNDGYSTSAYRFTAPTSGKYLMCVFGLVGTATNWEMRVRKNGVNYSRHYIDGSRALSGSCVMDMNANDYAEIGCGHDVYLHQTDTYSGWSITKVA